jgi:hypothetical protein
MRIWDREPKRLCRNHLLGEHRELHAIGNILTMNKKGYSRHPEVLRWKGKLKALFLRHEGLVREMTERGYRHQSPLNAKRATGVDTQDICVDSYEEQIRILKNKKCGCDLTAFPVTAK